MKGHFEARNLRQLNSQYLLRIRYVHTVLAYMEIRMNGNVLYHQVYGYYNKEKIT